MAQERPLHPRPMKGIFVAISVMNCTLAEYGRAASGPLHAPQGPIWPNSIAGSGRMLPSARAVPCPNTPVMSEAAVIADACGRVLEALAEAMLARR